MQRLIYFLGFLCVALALALPVWAQSKPSPLPSPTPLGWYGIGWLEITSNPPYDLKKTQAACEYTKTGDDSANWECYSWDEKTRTVDWSHSIGEGSLVGDFSKGGPIAADGTVADYLWAVFKDNSLKIDAHHYDLLQALPYTDPVQGSNVGTGPAGQICNSGDTSQAIQTSVANDMGSNGVGWHTYHNCPQQNWNNGSCNKVDTSLGWACLCSNAWGTYTQYEYPVGTIHYVSPTACNSLNRELFYWNGWVSKQ